MFDFHEKRKIRRVVYSWPFIGVIAVIAVLIGMSVHERYKVERSTALKLEERMEELGVLRERAALLETQVEHLKNERGIEEELRTRFDVAKPGEQVVIIVDEGEERDEDRVSTSTTEEDAGEAPWFARFQFW